MSLEEQTLSTEQVRLKYKNLLKTIYLYREVSNAIVLCLAIIMFISANIVSQTCFFVIFAIFWFSIALRVISQIVLITYWQCPNCNQRFSMIPILSTAIIYSLPKTCKNCNFSYEQLNPKKWRWKYFK